MSTAIDPSLLERYVLKAFCEACLVLEDGVASMKDIDTGMIAGAGVVPPPFQAADAAGLDVLLERLERAAEEWGENFEPPVILRRLVAQGRLGRAAGQGFYAYPQPETGWEEGPLTLERRDPVAIVWLDRPPANSLSPEVVEALRDLWDEVRDDGRTRALMFASANPMLFCAGADIKAFTKMDERGARALAETMHALLREFERSPIVTVAAVGALAYGGGCELAMACDFRIAGDSASFGQPEIDLGIIPGFGGTQRLPRLIGEPRALEMNLTGQPIAADEAYELGLVNRLVPDQDLFDTALNWCRALAAKAPVAVGRIKQLSAAADLDAGLAAEQQAFAEVFGSQDASEGIAAFLGKRAPRFRGR
jgi:enoyl-CoA hydratase/3-hydroxyacyl-CoA dehydrogenase